MLSQASQAAQCQTKAVMVHISLSYPVFRSQSPISESMSPDLRQTSRYWGQWEGSGNTSFNMTSSLLAWVNLTDQLHGGWEGN